ncbi:MAG TPA: sulfatase, partial [Verrucomicrobiales bacterium]|nr:sulfatase [Verrucomicrobiales bacterium]
MNPLNLAIQRRSFLSRSTVGIGSLALSQYLKPWETYGQSTTNPSAPSWSGIVDPLHFTQKAKRVIYLCMAGGPSHLETLDHKPKLAEMDGKPMPDSITRGQPIAQLQGQKLNCLG